MSHALPIAKVKKMFPARICVCQIKISLFLLYIEAVRYAFNKMLWFFNIFYLTNNATYYIYTFMAKQIDPYQYFAHPKSPGQKQYEALRAFYIDNLPARVVADRFGYTVPSFNALKQKFKAGKLSFKFTEKPGPQGSRLPKEVQQRIFQIRRVYNLSSYRIAEILAIDGIEVNPRTINRLLEKAGFPPVPRRGKLSIGETVYGAKVPQEAQILSPESLEGRTVECTVGGIFLFAPLIERLGLPKIVDQTNLPGSKQIPPLQYFLSFLALKLIGKERLSQVNDLNFDQGMGLFAGLNVLPKCTPISDYSYRLDSHILDGLLQNFVHQMNRHHVYRSDTINLDFHTIPHYGDESILQTHWVPTKGKRMKGALTLFAQDCESTVFHYAQADILRSEASEKIIDFVKFWKKVHGKLTSTLVFDSKLTSYEQLNTLNDMKISFITLRKRGKKLLAATEKIPHSHWQKLHLDIPKRKYKNPFVFESSVDLPGYDDKLRQVVMKGTGRERPSFLITNDFHSTVDSLIFRYAKRWRIENGIAEAVKFFSLNALSSPVLVKVHFDVLMTMIAHSLYHFLSQRLRGFEDCRASTIFRKFINMKADVSVRDGDIVVKFPRRSHNPIIKSAELDKVPSTISWLGNRKMLFEFR
ncbi:MAG: transposase [Deltaproteobacteria bacterium]|nr:MAG: transposase [Deltaproteobacteria bacterium]